jgi:hypothetical protein
MIQYMHSTALGIRIKINTETGAVAVEDKYRFKNGYVTYTAEEIRILAECGTEITKEIELMKNIFEGEVVRYEPPARKI